MSRRLETIALLCVFAACSEGVSRGPVPVDVDEPGAEPEAPPPDAPVKRVVHQRNPFGNVAATDNLLWDGDFEWRPSFPEQYGWLVGNGFGFGFGLPNLGTGPRCRSGIKCAVLTPGQSILGIAVGSEGSDLLISFWGHPDGGACDSIVSSLSPAIFNAPPSAIIEPVDAEPGEDGWCRYEAVAENSEGASYLSIFNSSTESFAAVDDAVIRAIGAEEMQARSLKRARPATAEEERELDDVRRAVHEARMPVVRPPTEGEKKLAAHLRRLVR